MAKHRKGAAQEPPAPPSRPSPWILSAGLDLLLFIGTPALIVPVVLLAHGRWSSAQIYLFVASFGAIGHHLPGMLRAYGDRALFSRFRLRFVIAPLFLLGSCIWLAFEARAALTLAVFAWGAWHGAMQIHGFARIYDGKAGSTSLPTALLDQALALAWFATVIAWSDVRLHYILDHALQAGLPAATPAGIHAMRVVVFSLTAAITAAWAARALLQWRAGTPPSRLKILLLVTSVGFYAWANVAVHDLLLAVVLFEAFHDVQYLTIVWLFNRRRAESDPAAGAFTRFLFRPRLPLLLAYVGLCFAYGTINLLQASLPQETLSTVLAGVLAASGLLHFYYDGFIWKLRERQVREGLGLAGGAEARKRGPIAAAAVHGAKWATLFALPLGALAATTARAPSEGDRMLALASALPEDAGAQRNLAVELERRGDLDGAVAAARRARDLAAKDAAGAATQEQSARTLAALLGEQALAATRADRLREAATLIGEAIALDPQFADRLSDETATALEAGRVRDAEMLCRALLGARPDHGTAHYNLAAALAAQGRLPEAHVHALRAVALMPSRPEPQLMVERLRAGIEAAAAQR